MLLNLIKNIGISLFVSTVIAATSFAAQVTQVKNNKVMIDNQGEDLQIGQEYYLVSGEAKKVGLVQISIVKNGKAIGTITKGKSNGKEVLQLKPGSQATVAADVEPEVGSESVSTQKIYRYNAKKISVVLGMFSNSMTAKESNGIPPNPSVEDVAMKGSSMGITGVLDLPMSTWFTLRGTAGYEPFKTSGTAVLTSCDNATSVTCTAEMNYLSFGAFARFDFYRAKALIAWAALGGTMRYPISKSSTALKTEDVKMTGTYGFAVGVDYFISNKYFIPISIDQQYFMPSDTVKANVMAIRFGIGKAF